MTAALLILGLAVGALLEGGAVVSRSTASGRRVIERSRQADAPQRAFAALFDDSGPFLSTDARGLSGDASAFAFPCAEAPACGARLVKSPSGVALEVTSPTPTKTIPLPNRGELHFEYAGSLGRADHWPSGDALGRDQALQSVEVVDAKGRIVLVARIWREQPINCAYDAISRACRSEAAP